MPELRTKKKLGKQALLRRAVTKINRDFCGNELIQRPLNVKATETAEPKLLYCAPQNISVLPSLATKASLVQAMQHALNSSDTCLSRSRARHKARQKRVSKAKSRATSGINGSPMMLHCSKDVSTSMSGVTHKLRKSGLSLSNSATLKSQNSSRSKNSATGSYPSTWNIDDGKEKTSEVVSSLAEVANCDCLNRTPYDHKLATPTTKHSKSMVNCCQSIMRPVKAPASKPQHKTNTRQQAAPIVTKAQSVPKSVTRHSTQTKENSWSQTPKILEHKATEINKLERNQKRTNKANELRAVRPKTTTVSIGTSTPHLATPQTRIVQVAKRRFVSKKKYSQKFTPSGVSVYSSGGQDIDDYENSYKSNVPCHINIQKLNRSSNIQLQCNNLKIICCNCDNSNECICLNDAIKGISTAMAQRKSSQSSKSSLRIAEEQRYADTEDYASDSGLDEGEVEECDCPDVYNRESQHLGRIEKISQPPSVHARRDSARSARKVSLASFEDASSTEYEVSKVPQKSTDHVSGIFYMPHEKEIKKLMELDDDDDVCEPCLRRNSKKVAPYTSDDEADNKSQRSNSLRQQNPAYETPNSRKQRDQRSKGKNMNAYFCEDKRCVRQCQNCSNQIKKDKQEMSSSMQGACPDVNCNRRCRRCMPEGANTPKSQKTQGNEDSYSLKHKTSATSRSRGSSGMLSREEVCPDVKCNRRCRRCKAEGTNTPKSQKTRGKEDSYSLKHKTSATRQSLRSSGMLSREASQERISAADTAYSKKACYCKEVERQKPKDLSSSEDEFGKDVECTRRCKRCIAIEEQKLKPMSRNDSLQQSKYTIEENREDEFGKDVECTRRCKRCIAIEEQKLKPMSRNDSLQQSKYTIEENREFNRAAQSNYTSSPKEYNCEDEKCRKQCRNCGLTKKPRPSQRSETEAKERDSKRPSRVESVNREKMYRESEKSSIRVSAEDLRIRGKKYGDSRKPSQREKESTKSRQRVSEESLKVRVNKYEESRKSGRRYSEADPYNATKSKKSSRVDSAEDLKGNEKKYDKSRKQSRRDSEENLYREAKGNKCPKSCRRVYREDIPSAGAENNLIPRGSSDDLENVKGESRKPTDEIRREENEKDAKKSSRKSSKEQLLENCMRCCNKGLNSDDLKNTTEDRQSSNKVRPSSNVKSKPSRSKSSVKKKGSNGKKSKIGNKSRPDSERSDNNANSSRFDKSPNPFSAESKATEPYGRVSVGFCSDDECDMTCPRCRTALAKSRQQDQKPMPHKSCVPQCTKTCNLVSKVGIAATAKQIHYYGAQGFYAAPAIGNQHPTVTQFNSNSSHDRELNSAYNQSGNKPIIAPKETPAFQQKTYNNAAKPDKDHPGKTRHKLLKYCCTNKRHSSESLQSLHKDSGNKFRMNPAEIHEIEDKPGTTGRLRKSLLGGTLSKIKETMHKCSMMLVSRNRFHKDPSDIYALRSGKQNLYSSKSKSKDFEKRTALDKLQESTPSTVMNKKQEYNGPPNWMCGTESKFNKHEITYPTEPISKAKFGKYMPHSEEDFNTFNLKNYRTKTTSQNNEPGPKTKQSKPIPPIKPSNKPAKLKPIKDKEVDFAASLKRFNRPDDVKVLYDSSYKFVKSRDSECEFLSLQQRQKMPMVYGCDSFLKSSDCGAWSKSRNKTKNHGKSSANNFFSIFSFKTKVPPKPKPKPQQRSNF